MVVRPEEMEEEVGYLVEDDENYGRRFRKVPKEPEVRFFLAAEPVVSAHGVIGLLICDKNPGKRWEYYTSPDWTGVPMNLDPDDQRNKSKYEEPVRRRRFWNTEDGICLIRIFILPENAENFLWNYPGKKQFEPAALLDEQEAIREWCPMRENAVEDLYKSTVNAVWEKFGIGLPEDDYLSIGYHPQEKPFISFHGWQDFMSATSTAQQLTQTAIAGFDAFLDQFATEHPDQYKAPVRNNPPGGAGVAKLAR